MTQAFASVSQCNSLLSFGDVVSSSLRGPARHLVTHSRRKRDSCPESDQLQAPSAPDTADPDDEELKLISRISRIQQILTTRRSSLSVELAGYQTNNAANKPEFIVLFLRGGQVDSIANKPEFIVLFLRGGQVDSIANKPEFIVLFLRGGQVDSIRLPYRSYFFCSQ